MDAIQMELFEMAVEHRVLREHGLDYLLEAEDGKEGIIAKVKRKIKELFDWIGKYFDRLNLKHAARRKSKADAKYFKDNIAPDDKVFKLTLKHTPPTDVSSLVPDGEDVYKKCKAATNDADVAHIVDNRLTKYKEDVHKALFNIPEAQSTEDYINSLYNIEEIIPKDLNQLNSILEENSRIVYNLDEKLVAAKDSISKAIKAQRKVFDRLSDEADDVIEGTISGSFSKILVAMRIFSSCTIYSGTISNAIMLLLQWGTTNGCRVHTASGKTRIL